MDAYQSYHQIFMAKEDAEKTAFVTEKGVYCYNVMPFGLKNAGVTYQRLVNKMFKDQIGNIMEVYLDDMLVKRIFLQGPDGVEIEIEIAVRLSFPATNNEAEHEALIQDLQTTFDGGVKQLDVYTDSQLVAAQVQGSYETREWTMTQYLAKVKKLMEKFDRCAVH
ncbi:uncharacterized protein LOC105172780 [Sesamum indicum]|uniref:Uncharacterized protein LOC105172780 n=1 Tax=Sesamum indicum TaxID=4182 RepID=A0A6I9U4U9_SESIN|nr:uncharacterized protein LOC105172780 [Sesamum indicum]